MNPYLAMFINMQITIIGITSNIVFDVVDYLWLQQFDIA